MGVRVNVGQTETQCFDYGKNVQLLVDGQQVEQTDNFVLSRCQHKHPIMHLVTILPEKLVMHTIYSATVVRATTA